MSDVPSSAVPVMPWWILPSLAAGVLVIFAGALAASCFIDDNTLRTQMFTGAYGLATGAVGYYFGSSAGSAKKDETIQAGNRPQATTTTTKVDPDASTITETKTGPFGEATPPAAEKRD